MLCGLDRAAALACGLDRAAALALSAAACLFVSVGASAAAHAGIYDRRHRRLPYCCGWLLSSATRSSFPAPPSA